MKTGKDVVAAVESIERNQLAMAVEILNANRPPGTPPVSGPPRIEDGSYFQWSIEGWSVSYDPIGAGGVLFGWNQELRGRDGVYFTVDRCGTRHCYTPEGAGMDSDRGEEGWRRSAALIALRGRFEIGRQVEPSPAGGGV